MCPCDRSVVMMPRFASSDRYNCFNSARVLIAIRWSVLHAIDARRSIAPSIQRSARFHVTCKVSQVWGLVPHRKYFGSITTVACHPRSAPTWCFYIYYIYYLYIYKGFFVLPYMGRVIPLETVGSYKPDGFQNIFGVGLIPTLDLPCR